jgi:hypothetical protein
MKRKRKAPSVDAMMRFFLQYYNIPTKQDVEKVLQRLDRLEALINAGNSFGTGPGKGSRRKAGGQKRRNTEGRVKKTATEQVIKLIEASPKGIDVAALKTQSGFEDKKVRNIVFRLCKEGTIKRVGRGIYAIGH